MVNPLNIYLYQAAFWDKATLGEKAVLFNYVAISAVAMRILSAMQNNTSLPFFPKNFGIYEGVATFGFLVYLFGSTGVGYVVYTASLKRE